MRIDFTSKQLGAILALLFTGLSLLVYQMCNDVITHDYRVASASIEQQQQTANSSSSSSSTTVLFLDEFSFGHRAALDLDDVNETQRSVIITYSSANPSWVRRGDLRRRSGMLTIQHVPPHLHLEYRVQQLALPFSVLPLIFFACKGQCTYPLLFYRRHFLVKRSKA